MLQDAVWTAKIMLGVQIVNFGCLYTSFLKY